MFTENSNISFLVFSPTAILKFFVQEAMSPNIITGHFLNCHKNINQGLNMLELFSKQMLELNITVLL